MPWEVIIPPEQEALYCALAELPLSKLLTLQVASRLTEPPESLSLPAAERTEMANELIDKLVGCDGDMAARMLRLNEGKPDPQATWTALNPAERKRAKLLERWALDSSLDSTPQGRPSVIDSALVLYCSRLLVEACEKPKFKFARPADGGPPGGPMWRALVAALPLAESYLARVEGVVPLGPRDIGKHAETIAEILKIARSSKQFAKLCLRNKLGSLSSDVAQHPSMFRKAMSHARRPRPRKRRTPA